MPVPRPAASADEWSAAFARICDRYRGRLVAWATAVFGARDAEDIAQEALARLYARPELLDPASDAWPWLSVVARNVGRDLARRNALTTTVEQEVFAAIPADAVVSDEVIARDDALRLARALRRLTPRERAVIRLRDIEGATIADIAEIVGSNENAVRQQLYRARRRLATVYLAMGGERRLGLAALVSLWVREKVRRYGHYLSDLGAPSGVLASVLPPLAVGGGLVLGVPGLPGAPGAGSGPGTGAPGVAGYTDRDVRHGMALGPGALAMHTGEASPDGSEGRPGSPRPGPILDTYKSVGPAATRATVHGSATSENGGRIDDEYIWIMLPNGSRLEIHSWDETTPGYQPLCTADLVIHCEGGQGR